MDPLPKEMFFKMMPATPDAEWLKWSEEERTEHCTTLGAAKFDEVWRYMYRETEGLPMSLWAGMSDEARRVHIAFQDELHAAERAKASEKRRVKQQRRRARKSTANAAVVPPTAFEKDVPCANNAGPSFHAGPTGANRIPVNNKAGARQGQRAGPFHSAYRPDLHPPAVPFTTRPITPTPTAFLPRPSQTPPSTHTRHRDPNEVKKFRPDYSSAIPPPPKHTSGGTANDYDPFQDPALLDPTRLYDSFWRFMAVRNGGRARGEDQGQDFETSRSDPGSSVQAHASAAENEAGPSTISDSAIVPASAAATAVPVPTPTEAKSSAKPPVAIDLGVYDSDSE